MKLIVPAFFFVKGGIERVMISLIREFDHLTDGVVILLPKKSIDFFQQSLADTSNVTFEPVDWPPNSTGGRQLRDLGKVRRVAQKLRADFLLEWLGNWEKEVENSARIRYLARKHQCTHCLYFISNNIQTPKKLDLPVTMLSHDLFWHFAPLTYPDNFVQRYDKSLEEWLKCSNKVITVSQKTRSDLLKIFPEFGNKVKAIPSASSFTENHFLSSSKAENILSKHGFKSERTTFFFPSSFSLYKDHLTLIEASIEASKHQKDFKVLLSGKDTDKLANGCLDLGKQRKTLEYDEYVERLKVLHKHSDDSWQEILFGLGYCNFEVVEAAYQRCDCVVMPSRYEGFGLAISEAIVRGLPVIAADIDVFHEQVDLYQCHDRVLFFKPGDADELKAQMLSFLNNPLRKLDKAEVASRFDHWNWKSVAESYIEEMACL